MEPVRSFAKILLVFGLFLGASAWVGQQTSNPNGLEVTTVTPLR